MMAIVNSNVQLMVDNLANTFCQSIKTTQYAISLVQKDLRELGSDISECKHKDYYEQARQELYKVSLANGS